MAKTEIITPVGMVMFPNFFTPKPKAAGQTELVYNGVLVFDPKAQETEAFQKLKKAVADEAKDFFKGKVPSGARNPLIKAKETEYPEKYDGFYEDSIFIRPWSKYQPGVVDARNQDITIESDVWAGQMFRFSVTPQGYNTNGNRGVMLFLNHVQQAKADMPRMDGRKSAAATFDTLEKKAGGGGDQAEMADATDDDFFN